MRVCGVCHHVEPGCVCGFDESMIPTTEGKQAQAGFGGGAGRDCDGPRGMSGGTDAAKAPTARAQAGLKLGAPSGGWSMHEPVILSDLVLRRWP